VGGGGAECPVLLADGFGILVCILVICRFSFRLCACMCVRVHVRACVRARVCAFVCVCVRKLQDF